MKLNLQKLEEVEVSLGTIFKVLGFLVVIAPFFINLNSKINRGVESAAENSETLETIQSYIAQEPPKFDSIFDALDEQNKINEAAYCRGRIRDHALRGTPIPDRCEEYR